MKGVVFDTTIWIEYLRGNSEYFSICQELLENGRVWSLELIFAELFQGAKGKKEMNLIMDYLSNIPLLDEPLLIIEAGILSNELNLINDGVGLIDAVIIHSVRKNQLQLWTLDEKIRRVIGYDFLFRV
ncbi:PIN domain-containing protein [Pararhodonellum marinum]|uniref:PIN domain-containing protein n=1 Tax=Pararhodonellum marinum TaxID=2755358 RepID=UPI001890AFA6|nr:PIN domain-containing protein [Pararhodonellum marinum]